MKKALIKIFQAPIRAYKYFISPLTGANCRFYPSCSQYALEALEVLPFYKAIPKIIWRILRCNPWTCGGHDPVIKENSNT